MQPPILSRFDRFHKGIDVPRPFPDFPDFTDFPGAPGCRRLGGFWDFQKNISVFFRVTFFAKKDFRSG